VSEPGPRAPAGWYDDPGAPGVRRYWSGESWGDPPPTALDGPALFEPAGSAPSPLVCDECGAPADTLHVLPDGDRPESVALACIDHDPGGEWWDLTGVDSRNRALQNAPAFDRLRPESAGRCGAHRLKPHALTGS